MIAPLSRRPLRVKLTVLLVAMLSLGLFLSSLAATTFLRNYLLDRVDEQLIRGSEIFQQVGGKLPAPPPSDQAGVRPPSRFFAALYFKDGRGTLVLSTPDSDPTVTPAIPSAAEVPLLAGAPFTVGSVDGAEHWRVYIVALRDGSGWAVMAAPLADVQATVGRLVLLQLLVGLVVVVLAGVAGYLLVRRSLRPLGKVADTSMLIAAGDLSLRVPVENSSVEVEELSTSFNAMVTRIEESFAAQQASENQARASEERMRRFVADAGHELRTPLTSIRGYAELLEEGAVDDPAVAVARIQNEAIRMGSLVDDLQTLARLDQQPTLVLRPVDLADVITAAAEAARAAEPGRVISCDLASTALVAADERQMRQVLDNLLSNALRYSPGDAPIVVRCAVVERDLRVDVIDHGPGLEREDAERVFERLFRADEARSRVHGGSGLGLSIVKSIVEAHGGTVFVQTAPGEGSDFGFLLPLASAQGG